MKLVLQHRHYSKEKPAIGMYKVVTFATTNNMHCSGT